MPVLAVAGLSARLMAEAASRDGFDVIALDLFGDTDTRRASQTWWPIGNAASLRIDAEHLLAALAALAARGDVIGWVAGSGFESRVELLERGAELLPIIGTAPRAVQRVRDPREFFACLGSLGIAHPEVRYKFPDDPVGWMLKDAHGTGGWHVRPAEVAAGAPLPGHLYVQRRTAGVPMSVTFIATGHDARVLGFNQMLTRRVGDRPFVFRGVVGPVPVPLLAAGEITRAVSALARHMDLRGLGSLDFLLDGDRVQVLEVNPRPPASLALYGQRVLGGVMAAHVRACQTGDLPTLIPQPDTVQGSEIVFARRRLAWGAVEAAWLAVRPDAHDLPSSGSHFAPGDPLCSLSAAGPSAQDVIAQLKASREQLLDAIDTNVLESTR